MEPIEIIAQIIGIVAMALNILSYQWKNQRNIILTQFFGSGLFVINFFMLGAATGAIINLLAVFRAIVFANKKFFRADKVIWVVGFIAAFLASYAATFLVFGKGPTAFNLIIEFLPIIGIIATTISFYMKDAKAVRRLALISSPAWLIYNVTQLAIGGIICEAVSLVSIIVGMLRHDRKNKASVNSES